MNTSGSAVTAGVADSDPHILRHSFATQLIRGGTDPVLVADLLGHADIATLAVYTQPSDADRERALALLTTDT